MIVDTIFQWCNNINQMRLFYSDILGAEETFYRDDSEHGWLTYQLADLQLVFIRSDEPLPIAGDFAINPAHQDGTRIAASWVLKMGEEKFRAAIHRLQQAGIASTTAEPYSNRPGHLQYIVLDPMGLTLELFTVIGDEAGD